MSGGEATPLPFRCLCWTAHSVMCLPWCRATALTIGRRAQGSQRGQRGGWRVRHLLRCPPGGGHRRVPPHLLRLLPPRGAPLAGTRGMSTPSPPPPLLPAGSSHQGLPLAPQSAIYAHPDSILSGLTASGPLHAGTPCTPAHGRYYTVNANRVSSLYCFNGLCSWFMI